MTRQVLARGILGVAIVVGLLWVMAYKGSGRSGGDTESPSSAHSRIWTLAAAPGAVDTPEEPPGAEESNDPSLEGTLNSAQSASDREEESSPRSDDVHAESAEDAPREPWQTRFMRKRNEATQEKLRDRNLPRTVHGQVAFASLKERDPLTCAVYAKSSPGIKSGSSTLESGIVDGQYTFGQLAEGTYDIFVTETEATPGMRYDRVAITADSPLR